MNSLLLSLLLLDGSGDSAELFSTINSAIALLDKYERKECEGVEIAFNKDGKYFEKSKGANWWTYYFEPLKVGEGSVEKLHNYQKRILSLTAQFEMPLERSHELFERYIHVKKEVLEKVPSVEGCIGVYYHKPQETKLQPVTPYEEVLKKISLELKKGDDLKLFVVSPDPKFISFLEEKLPGKVVTFGETKKGKFAEGEKELIQALALSQTKTLIRTSNTFSKAISELNPNIFAIDLDKNWQEIE